MVVIRPRLQKWTISLFCIVSSYKSIVHGRYFLYIYPNSDAKQIFGISGQEQLAYALVVGLKSLRMVFQRRRRCPISIPPVCMCMRMLLMA